MFENKARYLADWRTPNTNTSTVHCIAHGDLEGNQELLQKELDLMRKHSRYHWNGFSGYGIGIERGYVAYKWSVCLLLS
jgi:hypothetical protein